MRKKSVCFLLLAVMLLVLQVAAGQHFDRLAGYQDVTVERITRKGIRIRHSEGNAIITESQLKPWEKKLLEAELKELDALQAQYRKQQEEKASAQPQPQHDAANPETSDPSSKNDGSAKTGQSRHDAAISDALDQASKCDDPDKKLRILLTAQRRYPSASPEMQKKLQKVLTVADQTKKAGQALERARRTAEAPRAVRMLEDTIMRCPQAGNLDELYSQLAEDQRRAKNRYSGDELFAAATKGDLKAVQSALKWANDNRFDESWTQGGVSDRASGFTHHDTQFDNMFEYIDSRDGKGKSALMLAAGNGHTEIVELLVRNKADVNARDYDMLTPLMHAAQNGHVEIVKLLIRKKADVNARSKEGSTAWMYAVASGHTGCAESLSQSGTDLNAEDMTALMGLAVSKGNAEIVKWLIQTGADVNRQLKSGGTVLMHAVGGNHVEIVDQLIQAGADVNAKDKNGLTALLLSIKKDTRIVDMLIRAGADVNEKNKDGSTALKLAALFGQTEVVKLLIQAGADVNAKDNRGVTALLFATMKRHREIVKLLIQAGADVNATESHGLMALNFAAANGYQEIIDMLIQAGADVEAARMASNRLETAGGSVNEQIRITTEETASGQTRITAGGSVNGQTRICGECKGSGVVSVWINGAWVKVRCSGCSGTGHPHFATDYLDSNGGRHRSQVDQMIQRAFGGGGFGGIFGD